MFRNAPIRRHTRFPFRCRVTYRSPAVIAIGSLVNFSRAGAHILGSRPVAVGMPVSVRISIPEKDEDLYIAEATVRWVKGFHFGIETQRVSQTEQSWLNHYHDQLLGAPPAASKPERGSDAVIGL
jgi:hypothetical protein